MCAFYSVKEIHEQILRNESSPQEYHFPVSLCRAAVSNLGSSHQDLTDDWKMIGYNQIISSNMLCCLSLPIT